MKDNSSAKKGTLITTQVDADLKPLISEFATGQDPSSAPAAAVSGGGVD
eukprot:CAMPEP_0185571618 /NCGR_PEP_ID=MMETSP0434-20130131/3645_1 /TAXON_ID=626734 ORGANISM="Favella taraikaensis, Strain Fe Narragansett Bay" /NCGR_SAMPLE_ID=MMETSP0434 /ASSEMBLY_ACC=CAM_ASM_000379 /LENGTH=48 /DNA_ID= /DNA_START= /DNA_END= /DNA_ORIENTATION=